MTKNGESMKPTLDSQVGHEAEGQAKKIEVVAKKAYHSPALTSYGDVRDITLGTSIVPGESPGFESPTGGPPGGP